MNVNLMQSQPKGPQQHLLTFHPKLSTTFPKALECEKDQGPSSEFSAYMHTHFLPVPTDAHELGSHRQLLSGLLCTTEQVPRADLGSAPAVLPSWVDHLSLASSFV
jgi:hypothetical protein